MAIRNRAARRWGHRYVQGSVNAYCPACSALATTEQGRPIVSLSCRYDDDPSV